MDQQLEQPEKQQEQPEKQAEQQQLEQQQPEQHQPEQQQQQPEQQSDYKQQHDIIIKMETESEGEDNTEEQLTHTQTETTSQTEAETENDESGSEESSEEGDFENKFVDNPGHVHNRWSGKFKINEFHEDKPVITDAFRKAFDERKRKQKEICLLNGWEECDVTDCFCKSEESLGPGKQVANHKPANSDIV